ncbi:MAG: hypothetical protein H7A45_05950 [Verrucomicrobiales bacterium]|nr:hypothetical protein [Verrucomicrobiales bacterium]
MNKTFTLTLISLLTLGLSGALRAAEVKPETAAKVTADAAAEPAKRASAGYPFRGKLGAVDKEKLTLTVTTKSSKRTFQLSKDTKFTKNGKPAKLSDGVIGEEVAGYVKKLEEGKQVVTSVRFGPKPDAKAEANPKTGGTVGNSTAPKAVK